MAITKLHASLAISLICYSGLVLRLCVNPECDFSTSLFVGNGLRHV